MISRAAVSGDPPPPVLTMPSPIASGRSRLAEAEAMYSFTGQLEAPHARRSDAELVVDGGHRDAAVR